MASVGVDAFDGTWEEEVNRSERPGSGVGNRVRLTRTRFRQRGRGKTRAEHGTEGADAGGRPDEVAPRHMPMAGGAGRPLEKAPAWGVFHVDRSIPSNGPH